MASLRKIEQLFRSDIEHVTQKRIIAFAKEIVASTAEAKDDDIQNAKLLIRTALTNLKPRDQDWIGYYDEMKLTLSSQPATDAIRLLHEELNHAYAESLLEKLDSTISNFQPNVDLFDLYSALSKIERALQGAYEIQTKITNVELSEKLTEKMNAAKDLVFNSSRKVAYIFKAIKEQKHNINKQTITEAEDVVKLSFNILINAKDDKKIQKYINRIGFNASLKMSDDIEDETIQTYLREQIFHLYINKKGFEAAYNECLPSGKELTSGIKYYLAMVLLRDFHTNIAKIGGESSFATKAAPLIDIIGLKSRDIIAALPGNRRTSLENYYPIALVKKLESETDRCKTINYPALTRKSHKKGTQQAHDDLSDLSKLLVETTLLKIKDEKINDRRVEARQAAAEIININTALLASELPQVTKKINPDFTKAHAEAKVRRQPITVVPTFTSGLALRRAKVIKAQEESIADLVSQRQLLIQTLQNTTAMLLKLYGEKEIIVSTIYPIIHNAGIQDAYDICLTYSDPKAKLIFADNLLHQKNYTEFTLDQTQKLVNITAKERPEIVFYDIFMKNKEAINNVETLVNAILKSPYMLNWLLEKAPKKLDELRTLINAVSKPETAINIFDYIAKLEEEKPKRLQPGIGKELQLVMLNHPRHRTALFNDTLHAPNELKAAFRTWTIADFETELKNADYGNTLCWAMLCQPAIVDSLNKNRIEQLLRSLDFSTLSSNKIALLHPKVIRFLLEQIGQEPWDRVKERFTKDQMLVLTDKLNLADINDTIKTESLILSFAGKDLSAAVKALQKSERKKSACVLLRELDTHGFWQPTEKPSNGLIHHLVALGIYQPDNTYNLLDPQLNLSKNPLVRENIRKYWDWEWDWDTVVGSSFKGNANTKAFEFVISSPFILSGLNQKQIDACVKTGATKGMSTYYLLSTIDSFAAKGDNERQYAHKLLALVPQFLEGSNDFSDSEVILKLKLIDKYRQYLTELHPNYDKKQIADQLYTDIEKALRNKKDDQWKILGPLIVKNPELLSQLANRYKDFKPKSTFLGMIKYAFVGGGIGLAGIGIVSALSSSSLLPAGVASAFSTFATAATYALGLGALVSGAIASAGIVALVAVLLYAAKGPITRGLSWIANHFRHAVTGLNQAEKDQKAIQSAVNYLDPTELRQAFLSNDETRHGLGKALLKWEEENQVKIKSGNKDIRQLLNGIRANERYNLMWEKGGILGKAEYIVTRVFPIVLTLGLWYFVAESTANLNAQTRKLARENMIKESPPSPQAALKAAGTPSKRIEEKKEATSTKEISPTIKTSPSPAVQQTEKVSIVKSPRKRR